ncbi:glucose-6-phosphate exchanger SLC37A4 isoform X1 [Hydra vulgaris]|uniref:Glucose-6-phosphate exchanger SLC37A4 isoform X1 n=1 Tax=Hydra vulgaris TaxID=6087 RepID=A0ABM4D5W8_HYDVU
MAFLNGDYRIQKKVMFINMFIGYFTYYIVRKSCTYSMSFMLNDKEISLTSFDFGMLASVQKLFYTFGQILFGALSDKHSPKFIFACGLFLCGFSNILFSLCYVKYSFIFCWAFNGFFQGCGWQSIAVLVKKWYSSEESGTVWSLLSTSMNISVSIIPLLVTFLAESFTWRLSFVIFGLTSCALSFVVYSCMVDDPVYVKNNVLLEHKNSTSVSKMANHGSSLRLLFKSEFFVLVAVSYFLWTFLKYTIEEWLHWYLITEKQFSNYQGSYQVMLFQLGGLVSSLLSGVVSDQLINKFKASKSSPRLPVVIFCSMFVLLWLLVLQTSNNMVLLTFTSFFLGFSCFGPHTLFGLLVMENAPSGLSGTSHALASAISSAGGVLAGAPLSYLIDNFGWQIVFIVLATVSIGVTSLLFVVVVRSARKTHD